MMFRYVEIIPLLGIYTEETIIQKDQVVVFTCVNLNCHVDKLSGKGSNLWVKKRKSSLITL